MHLIYKWFDLYLFTVCFVSWAGVDVDTQIYEGDLFDFDVEVKPILEVLVGKTIEQSLLEVSVLRLARFDDKFHKIQV